MWVDLQGEIMLRLDSITIDDLCLNAHRGGLASEAKDKMDFAI
jgi:hypothetical protein